MWAGTIDVSFLIFIAFQKLPQNNRVSQSLNGDLYFSNIIQEDSREDYICYARFNHTQTIQQKQPISLKVQPGRYDFLNWFVDIIFSQNIIYIGIVKNILLQNCTFLQHIQMKYLERGQNNLQYIVITTITVYVAILK